MEIVRGTERAWLWCCCCLDFYGFSRRGFLVLGSLVSGGFLLRAAFIIWGCHDHLWSLVCLIWITFSTLPSCTRRSTEIWETYYYEVELMPRLEVPEGSELLLFADQDATVKTQEPGCLQGDCWILALCAGEWGVAFCEK